MATRATRALTVNTGSSSLKVAVYEIGPTERLLLSARAERIAHPGSKLEITDSDGAEFLSRSADLPDHDAALNAFIAWLKGNRPQEAPDAVGHRVVHGGSRFNEPQTVTPELISALEDFVPLAPDHLPQALGAIALIGRSFPGVPQVACFDTSFHRTMPVVAQTFALPARLRDSGIVRFGFHGLSCEYIVQELRRLSSPTANDRLIIAHLGNGASMTAVRGGRSVDTTMGLTPTGGLVMSTRTGDLDPGVLLYLLQAQGMTPAELNTLVNKQSGLLGVSGASGDMQDLLAQAPGNPAAESAIELFCYQAGKFIGALAAVLGGLDTLVFTGGIGEHADPVRARICGRLGFLGIRLDDRLNEQDAPVISVHDSSVLVRVIRTDEDLMIARHVWNVLQRNTPCSNSTPPSRAPSV